MKHAVDERGALHDIAHEHEQRHREQSVIDHDAIGALHHQIENSVFPPVSGWIEKGEEAKQHTQAHERECGGKTHHDRDHDEPEHRQTQCRVAHGFFFSSMLLALRWRAASSMACADFMVA
jgi:hypothetical protein